MAKMTKAQRSAAAKKGALTRKRNAAAKSRGRTRRVGAPRKKSMAQFVTQLKSAGITQAKGTLGGVIASKTDNLLNGVLPPYLSPFATVILGMGVEMLTGEKDVAAGMAGAGAQTVLREFGLDDAFTDMSQMQLNEMEELNDYDYGLSDRPTVYNSTYANGFERNTQYWPQTALNDNW